VRPLINYVWFAAFLMAVGGVIAATDRRYRRREESGE
jgi:cytochrome c biogenesis factor